MHDILSRVKPVAGSPRDPIQQPPQLNHAACRNTRTRKGEVKGYTWVLPGGNRGVVLCEKSSCLSLRMAYLAAITTGSGVPLFVRTKGELPAVN